MRDSLFHDRIPVQCYSQSVSSMLTCDMSHSYDELVIRLIDTNDIFKFYQCKISGASYASLKKEQELRVSFEEFTKKLVELFHQVKRNVFKALFSRDSLRFIFIEQNEFRNIVRLELKFNVPDDSDYKRYLAEMISNLEFNNTKLYKENIQIKESLKTIENEMSTRVKDLSHRNSELSDRCNNIQTALDKTTIDNESLIEQQQKDSKKLIDIEKENSNLKYEIDRIKIEQFKKDSEIKRIKEIEIQKEELEGEIKTANEIIRKMREETRRLQKEREEKDEILEETEQDRQKNLKSADQLKKQIKEKDEKIKKMKEALKQKDDKIRSTEMEMKSLSKKMEDAKFVYSHFYKKKDADQIDQASSISERDSGFNIEPESPPR